MFVTQNTQSDNIEYKINLINFIDSIEQYWMVYTFYLYF